MSLINKNKAILGGFGINLEKAGTGEGSRGGKIIGHTKSGKPIYAGEGVKGENFSKEDRRDAVKAAGQQEHKRELDKKIAESNQKSQANKKDVANQSLNDKIEAAEKKAKGLGKRLSMEENLDKYHTHVKEMSKIKKKYPVDPYKGESEKMSKEDLDAWDHHNKKANSHWRSYSTQEKKK